MTPEALYQKAERQARTADRNGGPLPVALLQEAAATGYAPAVYALANWYLHGKGVKKNYRKAVAFLKKAAVKRYPAAEYDLAVSYDRRRAVEEEMVILVTDWPYPTAIITVRPGRRSCSAAAAFR